MNLLIAKRYAKALFQLAERENHTEALGEQLEALADMHQKTPLLEKALHSPNHTQQEKRKVLDSLLEKEKPLPLLVSFSRYLLSKNRYELIGDISHAYKSMLDEKLGRVDVSVCSAYALTPARQKKLEEDLEAYSGKKPHCSFSTDPKLLGGMVLHMENKRHDFSLATRLNSLEKRLLQKA